MGQLLKALHRNLRPAINIQIIDFAVAQKRMFSNYISLILLNSYYSTYISLFLFNSNYLTIFRE